MSDPTNTSALPGHLLAMRLYDADGSSDQAPNLNLAPPPVLDSSDSDEPDTTEVLYTAVLEDPSTIPDRMDALLESLTTDRTRFMERFFFFLDGPAITTLVTSILAAREDTWSEPLSTIVRGIASSEDNKPLFMNCLFGSLTDDQATAFFGEMTDRVGVPMPLTAPLAQTTMSYVEFGDILACLSRDQWDASIATAIGRLVNRIGTEDAAAAHYRTLVKAAISPVYAERHENSVVNAMMTYLDNDWLVTAVLAPGVRNGFLHPMDISLLVHHLPPSHANLLRFSGLPHHNLVAHLRQRLTQIDAYADKAAFIDAACQARAGDDAEEWQELIDELLRDHSTLPLYLLSSMTDEQFDAVFPPLDGDPEPTVEEAVRAVLMFHHSEVDDFDEDELTFLLDRLAERQARCDRLCAGTHFAFDTDGTLGLQPGSLVGFVEGVSTLAALGDIPDMPDDNQAAQIMAQLIPKYLLAAMHRHNPVYTCLASPILHLLTPEQVFELVPYLWGDAFMEPPYDAAFDDMEPPAYRQFLRRANHGLLNAHCNRKLTGLTSLADRQRAALATLTEEIEADLDIFRHNRDRLQLNFADADAAGAAVNAVALPCGVFRNPNFVLLDHKVRRLLNVLDDDHPLRATWAAIQRIRTDDLSAVTGACYNDGGLIDRVEAGYPRPNDEPLTAQFAVSMELLAHFRDRCRDFGMGGWNDLATCGIIDDADLALLGVTTAHAETMLQIEDDLKAPFVGLLLELDRWHDIRGNWDYVFAVDIEQTPTAFADAIGGVLGPIGDALTDYECTRAAEDPDAYLDAFCTARNTTREEMLAQHTNVVFALLREEIFGEDIQEDTLRDRNENFLGLLAHAIAHNFLEKGIEKMHQPIRDARAALGEHCEARGTTIDAQVALAPAAMTVDAVTDVVMERYCHNAWRPLVRDYVETVLAVREFNHVRMTQRYIMQALMIEDGDGALDLRLERARLTTFPRRERDAIAPLAESWQRLNAVGVRKLTDLMTRMADDVDAPSVYRVQTHADRFAPASDSDSSEGSSASDSGGVAPHPALPAAGSDDSLESDGSSSASSRGDAGGDGEDIDELVMIAGADYL